MRFFISVASALLLAGNLAAQVAVTTSQYDNSRSGANLRETLLSPATVDAAHFGKLFSLATDGDVYAQPLFVPGLTISGRAHDVVFIASERDSVYAFDAAGQPATALWIRRFADPAKGVTAVPAQAVSCPFISPEVGITSTPVIDLPSRTLYLLVRTREQRGSGEATYWQRLHALDLTTGAERTGSPVTIRASLPALGAGLFGFMRGSVDFLALHENPRASLLLSRGHVYLSWASSCDVTPYHGWMMAYNARTLQQTAVFNTSPLTMESGIWQSDTGPAADENGNVYVATGNGVFNGGSGGHDWGDTLLKLGLESAGLTVADYFTPFDQAQLSRDDADLGSGGPVLIPALAGGPPMVVVGGKGGVIYAMPRDRLGKFHAGANAGTVQSISLGKSIKSAPAYWNGHVYYVVGDDVLRDFAVKNGRLSLVSKSDAEVREPGATPTVSANGTRDAIIWFIETRIWNGQYDQTATLHAYAAADLKHELYNSTWNRDRDRAGVALRFNIPTVAKGRVYIGTSGAVDVYGLLPQPPNGTKAPGIR